MPRPKAFDEDVALQKALATFWRRGFHATSMQDLVTGMGINRFSLYDTFGDKHQLFVRALKHYQQHSCQTLAALTENPALPALTRIRQVLDFLVAQVLDDGPQNGCFLVNATTERVPHDADTAAVAYQNQQFLEELFAGILAQGQARGEVAHTATPTAQAHLLISVLNGMRIMAKVNADPQVLHNVVNTVLLALAQLPSIPEQS